MASAVTVVPRLLRQTDDSLLSFVLAMPKTRGANLELPESLAVHHASAIGSDHLVTARAGRAGVSRVGSRLNMTAIAFKYSRVEGITLAVMLVFVAAALSLSATASGATCTVDIDKGLPAADNSAGCTPGDYDVLTKTRVCKHKQRPATPASVRREVLDLYGVPNWSGSDGEIDHRVPFFLGGRTDRANLWPERGSIPNEKDRLEDYVRRRICLAEPTAMRVNTARKVFLGDWRPSYRRYHLDQP
jgi:hypothetical protein